MTEETPELFQAVTLEIRPCISQILGIVSLLERSLTSINKSDTIPDLEKVRTAAQNFLGNFEHSINPDGTPHVDEGSDTTEAIRKIRHDLRTPVGHMIGYSEILKEDLESSAPPHMLFDLDRLCRSAQQLLALVNESLNISISENSTPDSKSLSIEQSDSKPALNADVLVVDDNEANRDLLMRQLTRHGYRVSTATNGREALEKLEGASFDLVLLDIMMPVMDGYEVLKYIREDSVLKIIPVIMISAIDEIDNVVTCIELGADDYLHKPFNPVLLAARVYSCLEKKKLRDQEQLYLQQLETEQAKSETLLLNILPVPIAGRLKRKQAVIADNFPTATVLFADIISFTDTSARLTPQSLVKALNALFSAYDSLADQYGLEKIKTIGDAYMVAGGLPLERDDHAHAIVEMGLSMLEETERLKPKLIYPFDIRVGISTGPVTAGVIGKKKFCYDLWGDTVNTASRLSGVGNYPHVRVTESTYELVKDSFQFAGPEEFEVKGKGSLKSYVINPKKA